MRKECKLAKWQKRYFFFQMENKMKHHFFCLRFPLCIFNNVKTKINGSRISSFSIYFFFILFFFFQFYSFFVGSVIVWSLICFGICISAWQLANSTKRITKTKTTTTTTDGEKSEKEEKHFYLNIIELLNNLKSLYAWLSLSL